jgi:hypothetical protein
VAISCKKKTFCISFLALSKLWSSFMVHGLHPGPANRHRHPQDFFNFNLFKLFLKLTWGQYYLHRVTLLAVPAGVARQLCHAGPDGSTAVMWARACRATPLGVAALPL